MHSAKKVDGKPLYELARQGIEIERAAKMCKVHAFDVLSYAPPCTEFRVEVSSGTYIRVLAQDFAKKLGTVGMLDRLRRTAAGSFSISTAITLDEACARATEWPGLGAWVDFDHMLVDFPRIDATRDEAEALRQGRQAVLPLLLRRADASQECAAIYEGGSLVAIARHADGTDGAPSGWGLERVFASN